MLSGCRFEANSAYMAGGGVLAQGGPVTFTDCVFTVSRDVTVDEVNTLLREAAHGELAGILGFEERPLVSADYTNDTRSGIVDGPSTMVIDGRMVKVLVWYDNEFGYSCQVVRMRPYWRSTSGVRTFCSRPRLSKLRNSTRSDFCTATVRAPS